MATIGFSHRCPGMMSTLKKTGELVLQLPAEKVPRLMNAGHGTQISYPLVMTNIAMGNGPFIDGLPIKNGDFPWLC